MLSIIVVSYNTRELLRQCLASLEAHSAFAEVVVVDNASRDGSAAMVRAEFPRVVLVELDWNAGFAGANNVGLGYVAGEFVLLLNSDTYVEDDTLDRCAAWMRSRPDVGAASPLLVGFDGVPQPCGHPFPTFRDRLRQTFRLSPSGRAGDYLIGAALMVRREAVRALDPFLDDAYFMYWEDTDLCARLREAGWGVEVFPGGVVRHHGGASSGGPWGDGQRPELFACHLRGQYRWFARHRPRWEGAGLWALEAIEVARGLLRGIRYRRPTEWRQAEALARVLWQILLRAPANPRRDPAAEATGVRRPAGGGRNRPERTSRWERPLA